MEKKTIGGFIAALRKASGLTQKQLAEKLNVSDKTISRWERDECAPDLSLIPVIAEIFGVTSDELLRGQRNNPENSQPEASEKKNEKQLQYLLKDIKTKYHIRSTITIGIGIAGLLAAMICNFGFNRAYIGFGVAMVFLLAAIICQTIFTILAFSAGDENEFAGKSLAELKKKLLNNAFTVFSAILVLIAGTLPLAIFPWDTFQGLGADSWLLYGLLFAGLTSVILVFLRWLLVPLFAKKGFEFSTAELSVNRLKIRWSRICAGLLLITFLGWCIFMIISPTYFTSGTVFDSWDDFKAHMELVAYDSDDSSSIAVEPDETFYPKEEIYAKDGVTVLCSYYYRNDTVSIIEFSDSDDLLPVTVYSTSDVRQGYNLRNAISAVFLIPAGLEIFLCLRQYRKRKASIAETSGLD